MNEAENRDPDKVCNVDGCNAWKQGEYNYCYHHKGLDMTTGAPKNNNNAVKHGLHQSAETFFENAPERHLDTYYAMHESLCSQYERLHGELPEFIRKDLSEVALDMAKLDMAKEYESKNAADPDFPITEMVEQMTESGPWKKEEISKVEGLKKQIRHENRMLLKQYGFLNDPESQKASAMERTLSEVLSEK